VPVTALHIGGGKATLSTTDSAVIRGADQKPFIPGSSLKGSLRSTTEKLAAAVPGVRTCALTDGEGGNCPGAPGEAQRKFHGRRRNEAWDERALLAELEALCDTCKLFGSPFQASKLQIDDLPLIDWAGVTQVRDGVGIDRDSERAVDRIKYDYEVVPPESSFKLHIMLEEPTDRDLALACLGLYEFVSGFGQVGGKRSRGLGRCELRSLKVYTLDLRDEASRSESLKKYLLGKKLEDKMTLETDSETFLQKSINALLEA
jgi:CRISPR-associated RAMP protein (TIGR02581 family)